MKGICVYRYNYLQMLKDPYVVERVEISGAPRGQSSTYKWNCEGRQTLFLNKEEMIISRRQNFLPQMVFSK